MAAGLIFVLFFVPYGDTATVPAVRSQIKAYGSSLQRFHVRNNVNGHHRSFSVEPVQPLTSKLRETKVLAEREISNRARLRQEVANPFAVVRLWGSGALSVQALVASLVATTRLTASIAHAPGAETVAQSAQTLGIDLACFAVLAGIFLREKSQETKRLEKFQREELLSQLVVELPTGKRATLQDIQGFARLVIVSGDPEQLSQSVGAAEEWRLELSERAVIVVPVLSSSGQSEADVGVDWAQWRVSGTNDERSEEPTKPFMLKPVRIEEWKDWIKEQKEVAGVEESQNVWISLRKDGRVRSSGKGFAPWQRFAQTIPPDKGAWGGFLDGMDGRV